MDKFQLTEQNLGRVFNYGCSHLCCYEAKLTNLKLKTWSKQSFGSLALAPPVRCYIDWTFHLLPIFHYVLHVNYKKSSLLKSKEREPLNTGVEYMAM